MIAILFYEKPGCINNTKQKRLLTEAGYQVKAKDLLAEPWTRESLAPYFAGVALAERFNQSAPQVKSGEVVPQLLDEEEAFALMLEEPLLIRRPLMKIGEHYLLGFEVDKLNQVLALAWDEEAHGDLESCPRYIGHACDEQTTGGAE
jgi:nitrogenase-associated protein